MPINYVALAKKAKKVIEENGRDVILVRKKLTATDTAKPWRGSTSVDTSSAPVKAIIYQIEERDEETGIVRRGIEVAAIAHDSLNDNNPETVDFIKDGTLKYKVTGVTVTNPGDTRLIYEFKLKR